MLDPTQVTEPVTVKPYLGSGPFGDDHGDPVATFCQYDGARKLVRAPSGEEVVSEVTLRLDPELDPALDLEALFAPESLVNVRGQDAVVINSKPFLDAGELIYVEVALA